MAAQAPRNNRKRGGKKARKPADATSAAEAEEQWDIDVDDEEDGDGDDSHLAQTSRKLASIQVVGGVTKHPNAEALSVAEVLGWSVIVRLDEVAAGDRVVFCEIDSMLPTLADWLPPAIRTRIGDTAGPGNFFRVKTIRLRDLPSQGLIVPLSLLPASFAELPVGSDVTGELGITKYQPNAVRWRAPRDGLDRKSAGKRARRGFPSHLISKTDETRIQSAPWLLKSVDDDNDGDGGNNQQAAASSVPVVCSQSATETPPTPPSTPIIEQAACSSSSTDEQSRRKESKGPLPYFITMKMDGTSSTFVVDNGELLVCSRNFVVNEPRCFSLKEGATPPEYPTAEYTRYFVPDAPNKRYEYCVYHLVARKYALQQRLAALGESYALQGEVVGPRIQKNLLNGRTVDLYVFNVVRTGPTRSLLSYAESLRVLERLNAIEPDAPALQMVPLIEEGQALPYREIAELVQLSKGFYPGTKNHREGLVIRFYDPETQAVRRSFKVINVDYLLKHD